MKQALAGYARGNRTYRQGPNARYGGNYPQQMPDPNQEPVRNDRPVLKRRN